MDARQRAGDGVRADLEQLPERRARCDERGKILAGNICAEFDRECELGMFDKAIVDGAVDDDSIPTGLGDVD